MRWAVAWTSPTSLTRHAALASRSSSAVRGVVIPRSLSRGSVSGLLGQRRHRDAGAVLLEARELALGALAQRGEVERREPVVLAVDPLEVDPQRALPGHADDERLVFDEPRQR